MKNITFFPYNARQNPDGTFDRVWDAADFARYHHLFIGTGLYPNPSNNLQVLSLFNNMRLTIRGGAAFINGHGYVQGVLRDGRVEGIDINLDVEANTTGTMRRDMIVLEHSNIRRDTQVLYIRGSTILTRNDDVWQLKLAEIAVNPGAISIAQSNITDTRLNREVCGIMYAMVDNVDTTTIFNQYMDYLERKQAEWDVIQKDQELNWQNQTARQETDWKEQTGQWQTDFEHMQAVWGAWIGEAIANPGAFFQRNFDNPAMYIGSTKWTTRIDKRTTLEEIRAGTLKAGSVAASRTTVVSRNKAQIEYVFYDLTDGSVLSRFIEHFEEVDRNTTKNYIEAVI